MYGVDRYLIEIMVGHEIDHLSIKAEYDSVRGFAQMHRVVGDRFKNRPKVRCRTAYDAEHLRSRCLLFQRLSQLVEQPAILDGDHSLGGEAFNEFNLFLGEWSHLLAIDHNCADQLLVFDHWHCQISSSLEQLNRRDAKRITFHVSLLSPDILDVDDFLFARHTAKAGFWPWSVGPHPIKIDKALRNILPRGRGKSFAIIKKKIAELRFTNAHGIREQCVKHRFELAWR